MPGVVHQLEQVVSRLLGGDGHASCRESGFVEDLSDALETLRPFRVARAGGVVLESRIQCQSDPVRHGFLRPP
jgi:hypothetical protein